jgi:DUF971 family protein
VPLLLSSTTLQHLLVSYLEEKQYEKDVGHFTVHSHTAQNDTSNQQISQHIINKYSIDGINNRKIAGKYTIKTLFVDTQLLK